MRIYVIGAARVPLIICCPLSYVVQLYNTVEEGRNFKRNLAALLRLDDSATLEACMCSVRHLLDHHGRTLELKADYMRRLEADQAANVAEAASMPARSYE